MFKSEKRSFKSMKFIFHSNGNSKEVYISQYHKFLVKNVGAFQVFFYKKTGMVLFQVSFIRDEHGEWEHNVT